MDSQISFHLITLSQIGIFEFGIYKEQMLKNRYSKEQIVLQELLKQLRIESSLTQDQLAKRLNTPQSFISKYESGERLLDFVELYIICQNFGLSITEFSTLYESSMKHHESKY